MSWDFILNWYILFPAVIFYFNIGYFYNYIDSKKNSPKFLDGPEDWTSHFSKRPDVHNGLWKFLDLFLWPLFLVIIFLIWVAWLIFGGFVKIFINPEEPKE